MITPDYTGKRIVITGAGSGIGRASALRFAELGAAVVVNDINGDSARKTVDAIRSAGGDALDHAADTTDPRQIDALVAAARR